jgi:retron-type reverse transcriptase
MAQRGGWVIDLDIQAYFDSVGHAHLRDFLDQRVRDGVIRRVLGKWMNAGVWENGVIDHPEDGVPQGGCISPLLSNLYLHEVLDLWFEREVKPRMRGRAFLVRFADDAVLGFEREDDARRVVVFVEGKGKDHEEEDGEGDRGRDDLKGTQFAAQVLDDKGRDLMWDARFHGDNLCQ